VAAEESVVRIPEDVPLNVAALFGCAALTGLGAVFEAAARRASNLGRDFRRRWRRADGAPLASWSSARRRS